MTKEPSPCPYCGKPIKSLALHKKFCKGKKEEPHDVTDISKMMQEPKRTIQPPPTPEPILKDSLTSTPNAPVNTPYVEPEYVKKFQAFSEAQPKESKRFWEFWKKVEPKKEIVSSPLELRNQKLPKWAINETKPFLLQPSKRKRLTQLVFHSRRPPYQEFMWVDTDELVVSVGHKGFKLPSAIHSGIVHWDADNDTPLLTEFAKTESGEVDIDPETGEIIGDQSQTALKTGMIKNYYFMLGKLANLKGLFTNAGLIMLLQIIIIIVVIADAYLQYRTTEAISYNIGLIYNQTLRIP